MRQFLKELAFFAEPRHLEIAAARTLRLKPFQIIVAISITPRGIERLAPETPRLPALLDTGHNHNFSLREDHLHVAGLRPEAQEWGDRPLRIRDASSREWDVPRLHLDIWLHSNLPRLVGRPFPLRVGTVGGACYLTGGPVYGPSLPVVGMRALCSVSAALDLRCYPTGGTLSLRLPTIP